MTAHPNKRWPTPVQPAPPPLQGVHGDRQKFGRFTRPQKAIFFADRDEGPDI
jgi:hypothetical protein